MKAIFVSDENPTYLGFWEPQAQHMWSRFGLKSCLYYIAKAPNPDLFASEYAEVKHIPLLSSVPAIVQALFAKWYFPGQETTDERLFVCDIDCFVLSKSFVQRVELGKVFFHLNPIHYGNVPGYYVAGTPLQFAEFFRSLEVSFEEFCLRAMRESTYKLNESDVGSFSKEASPDWKYFESEEHYAGACSRVYSAQTDCSTLAPNPEHNRICRSKNSIIDLRKLNEYIDYHCPRPYETYKLTITNVLKHFS